jgi:hypothetical protein
MATERSKARRLIQDSDEFIKSIKKFNKEKEEEISYNTETSSNTSQRPPVGMKLEFKSTKNTLQNTLHFWPNKVDTEDNRRDLLTFIESFYFKHKKLPNKADFEQRFDKAYLPKNTSDWQALLLSFQEPLTNRGLRPYETPLEYLEPNFVLAVNLIVNCYDKRAIAAKLKEAGLTTKQWTTLLRDEEHHEYYKARLGEIFDEDTQNDAKVALRQLIVEGDLGAIRHYHEMQNIYRPNAQSQNTQILLIMQAIMEILALHVSPDVLGRVANDIKSSSIITGELSEPTKALQFKDQGNKIA